MDKTSMTFGWLVGRQIAGQRIKQKTLIGYSYNGTVLPALPEWDKETYPYAYIAKNVEADVTGYEYGLVLRKSAIELNPDSQYPNQYPFFMDVLHKCIDNAWLDGIVGNGFNWAMMGEVLWSNTDVYYKDGTLYLAASDPIPVYE